ncbi:MAG: polymer-forming cytoskeletal protein [Pseudomonadota bacterium]
MSESRLRRLRDRSNGPATLISEGCKITGTLTGDGDFMINGEVDGECELAGSLTLASNGLWRGTIRAGTVIIAGTVEGDIESSGSVEIANTARINGTVQGQSIAVAVGAIVEGEMRTTGQSDPLEFVEKRDAGGALQDVHNAG